VVPYTPVGNEGRQAMDESDFDWDEAFAGLGED